MLTSLFESLLDYMIPSISNTNLSGSKTWGWVINRDKLQSRVDKTLRQEFSDLTQFTEKMFISYRKNNPDLFSELSEAILEDFFTHPEVKTFLEQNVSAPFPNGYSIPDTDWAILEPVISRNNISPYFQSKG